MCATVKALVSMLIVLYKTCDCEEIAGRCIKYGKDEEPPTIYGGDRFCLKEKGFKYCREWSCHSKCSNFDKWPGTCEACNDTCAVGGRLYNVGDTFTCVDNSNLCRCRHNNRFISTRVNASFRYMCFGDTIEIDGQ